MVLPLCLGCSEIKRNNKSGRNTKWAKTASGGKRRRRYPLVGRHSVKKKKARGVHKGFHRYGRGAEMPKRIKLSKKNIYEDEDRRETRGGGGVFTRKTKQKNKSEILHS